MGDLDLPNRIVMAPLTRMRAQSHDHVPTTLQAEYYAQRASAGLIIAEATAISPEGFGWADTPGLWTEEQVRGWRRITGRGYPATVQERESDVRRLIPEVKHERNAPRTDGTSGSAYRRHLHCSNHRLEFAN
jgi:hypothetical protein